MTCIVLSNAIDDEKTNILKMLTKSLEMFFNKPQKKP